jgi:hypothetical protein
MKLQNFKSIIKTNIILLFEEFRLAIDDSKPYKRVFNADPKKAISWKTINPELEGDLKITFKTNRGDKVIADFIDIGNKMEKKGKLKVCNYDMVEGSSSDGQIYTADVFYELGENSYTWEIKKIEIR